MQWWFVYYDFVTSKALTQDYEKKTVDESDYHILGEDGVKRVKIKGLTESKRWLMSA